MMAYRKHNHQQSLGGQWAKLSRRPLEMPTFSQPKCSDMAANCSSHSSSSPSKRLAVGVQLNVFSKCCWEFACLNMFLLTVTCLPRRSSLYASLHVYILYNIYIYSNSQVACSSSKKMISDVKEAFYHTILAIESKLNKQQQKTSCSKYHEKTLLGQTATTETIQQT